MKYRLRNLKVFKIAGTAAGAGKGVTVELCKSRSLKAAEPQKDNDMSKVKKDAALMEQCKAKLGDELYAQLEKYIGEISTKKPEDEEAMKAAAATAEAAKTEASETKKSLADLSKRLDDEKTARLASEKKAAETAEELAVMKRLKKAEDFPAIGDAETVAKKLARIEKLPAEDQKAELEDLAKTNAALLEKARAEGKEIGTKRSGGDDDQARAKAELETIAKKLRETDPKAYSGPNAIHKSMADAITQNQEVYARAQGIRSGARA